MHANNTTTSNEVAYCSQELDQMAASVMLLIPILVIPPENTHQEGCIFMCKCFSEVVKNNRTINMILLVVYRLYFFSRSPHIIAQTPHLTSKSPHYLPMPLLQ